MAMKQSPKSDAAQSRPALIPLGHYEGKPAIGLHRPVMVVGARADAHIRLMSKQVSQTHAILVIAGNSVYIRDMASRTHVYVNGQRVREAELTMGDEVKIGDFTFQMRASGASAEDSRPAPEGLLEIEGDGLPSALNGKSTLIGRRPTN